MILGIDFGTCYSSVAVMVGDEPVTSYLESSTILGVPSYFLYHDGEKYYGEDCESDNLFPYRGDIIKKMKREVRASPGNMNRLYQSGGRNFMLRNIVEDYLRYLITKVKMKIDGDASFLGNKEIEAVTITAPVAIGKNHELATAYMEFLKDAVYNITKIDKNNIHVFGEPAAAAVSYIYQNYHTKYDDKQTVLVFDLGGGTLDIVLVEHYPVSQEYRIIDRDGDLDLGGDNWDDVLFDLVRKKCGITSFYDDNDEYDFRREIIRMKIDLSSLDKNESVSYRRKNSEGRLGNKVEITRAMFDDATKPLLNRAMAKLMTVINNYERGIEGIDKIILVGGSSNMPQVRERIVSDLKGSMDDKNIISWDPSKAIARGAAIYARMLFDSDYGGLEAISTKTPHTYGIKVYDTSSSNHLIVRNIIFKNTDFDKEEYSVTLPDKIVARKSSIWIEVYESDLLNDGYNEESELTDDVVFSGMRMIVPVPEEYTGRENQFKVYVTMTLSRDGILDVTAKDSSTGNVCRAMRSTMV